MRETEIAISIIDVAADITRRLDSGLSIIKGISFSEYQLLAALRDHPAKAATRVDLASSVGLSPSGVTRALKPMERIGLVETTRDARDARKSLASLTPVGAETVRDADDVINDTVSTLRGIANMTAAQQRDLLKILTGLTA